MPFQEDGHNFIRDATQRLLSQRVDVDVTPPTPRNQRNGPQAKRAKREVLTRPRTFAHYVLNLPASAITFLPSFIGLYVGHENLFTPYTETQLPLIHVYCFNLKDDDNEEAGRRICEEISKNLGQDMRPGDIGNEGEVSIWDVRDVAPQKRMFCASFRLPAKLAFREP